MWALHDAGAPSSGPWPSEGLTVLTLGGHGQTDWWKQNKKDRLYFVSMHACAFTCTCVCFSVEGWRSTLGAALEQSFHGQPLTGLNSPLTLWWLAGLGARGISLSLLLQCWDYKVHIQPLSMCSGESNSSSHTCTTKLSPQPYFVSSKSNLYHNFPPIINIIYNK